MALIIETRPSARGTYVQIEGLIDENSDLSPLEPLSGRLEINLKGVRRVNSFGARAWMDAVRALAERATLVWVECSPPVLDQLNMIQGFLGGGNVESFYAPMRCDRCDLEQLYLFRSRDVRNNHDTLPEVECPQCARAMELDDLEEQYTLFLREPTRIGG